MPKLNKYETQRILLKESKVKRLKFQLKLCNLHFPLISLLLTLKTWSSAVSQRLNSLKYILSYVVNLLFSLNTLSSAVSQWLNSLKYILNYVVNLLFSMEEKPFGYGSWSWQWTNFQPAKQIWIISHTHTHIYI